MTHADRIREAERQVVDDGIALRAWWKGRGVVGYEGPPIKFIKSADALLALRAGVCPECKGEGRSDANPQFDYDVDTRTYEQVPGPCPAGCTNGEIAPDRSTTDRG